MTDLMSRITGPQNIGNGTTTAFTGTGGHTYSIRSIRIVNNTAAAITIKYGIGGVTDALLLVAPIALQAGATFHDDALYVMSGTETFQTNATASGCTITISGLDQS